ncbi:hypothetical protein [Azorhizobium doebereinerae]|uniref:hypothetical protein n=1 Tax=Azorhizobium doebereinerae TaxID=281091 RepID=UPI00041A135E|nr:hypothetical protein [Azorhizobium doebereinerae]
MSIFETAARKKFRFPSIKGELTAEQVWDLPLVACGPIRDVKADLDGVARTINTELRSISEDSFVSIAPDSRKADLEIKLDIVKHIITAKLKEADEKNAATARLEKRRKLVDALASKEDAALASMSREDILKELAAIDGGA